MPTRAKPLLIYDGECNFCRRWIERWRGLTQDRVDFASSQEVAHLFPEIPPESFRASVQLVETDGAVYGGAEAVFRSLAHAPGRSWSLWAYGNIPGFSAATEWFYRFVARHRRGFSLLTRGLWGRSVERPSYFLSRWLFLRLLGAIYLVAFLSLGMQLAGLVGSDGILPADPFLQVVGQRLGPERYHLLPTLCWLSAGDGFLLFLWVSGAILSGLLVLGLAPAPILLVLWVLYLSLSTVCRVFLGFQWDILLLETGSLAILLAPMRLWPRLSRESPPSPVVLWLLRWLLFRLLFSSGMVKLSSGDPTWWNLTALQFHYETQPLPTWIGWYAHQLPAWFQKMSAAMMFGIELFVPFLIFLPRRPRLFAFGSFVFFQTLIALTGNYCFFNLLTVALCLFLLDDHLLRRFLPRRWSAALPGPGAGGQSRAPRRLLVGGIAVVVMLVSSIQLMGSTRRALDLPPAVRRVMAWVAPLRSINGYGLFSRMTTTRPEIIVEGSNDGESWLPYEFKWKPGDPSRRPAFVEPHQPRLDWQMWFAALGTFRDNPWFGNFMVRLLQGSPEVLQLLEKNPFPDSPPRYVRATLYQYHFTDLSTRRATGAWWRREIQGPYSPVLSLRGR